MRPLLIIALMISSWACAGKPVIQTEHMVVYKAKDALKEMVIKIKNAISEHGIVINNISYVSEMLKRTGKDLGKQTNIFKDSQSIVFCSAKISRDTMEANPHNIQFCPYIINIYTISDEPNHVYIGYRRPPIVGTSESKKSLKAVENLLEEIIQDALSW